jgi:SAM-dependent methyltransferase
MSPSADGAEAVSANESGASVRPGRFAASDLLVHLLGWIGLFLHGDFFVFDRYLWLRRHIWAGPVRTLDAGSGSGAFAIYAAKLGNRVTAISFDRRNNAVAGRRAATVGVTDLELLEGDLRLLDEMAPELGEFDQVICLETIEHLMDDRKLVADLSALLRPGGQILLTTPNLDHRPTYKELERYTWKEDGGHVRYGYRHDVLRELFEGAGLRIEHENHVGGVLSQWFSSLMGWMVLRLRLPLLGAWAMTFPLRILRPIDTPLTKLIRYPFVSVAVVGRKPGRGSDDGA